ESKIPAFSYLPKESLTEGACNTEHIMQSQLNAYNKVGAGTKNVSRVTTLDLVNNITIAHIGQAIRSPYLGGEVEVFGQVDIETKGARYREFSIAEIIGLLGQHISGRD